MIRFVALLVVAAAGLWLLWPENADDPTPGQRVAPGLAPSPSGPLSRGIERSRAVVTIRRGERDYELRGRLDLSTGYRFRGRITSGGDEYLKNGTPIWLAGGKGSMARMAHHFDTFTKPADPRHDAPVWFDDHAPTLPLTHDPFGQSAEVYAHLSFLALKHAVHGRPYDFARAAGRRYNDIREVARAAGETGFDVTLGNAGRVERLQLSVDPATVDVRLFPSERPVAAPRFRRFAME
jgi:hypothetical protein